MTGAGLDPLRCAALILTAFSFAGCAQAAWLAWPPSKRLAWPLDLGATVRGRRLFGANKTVRGVVVMVPATAASFVIAAAVLPASGRWALPLASYGALGALAACGFMAAELPNSFVKRQLDIAPGQPARGPFSAAAFFLVDHLDSALGALGAIALAVPLPAASVAWLLAAGCVMHLAFSALTYRLGGKTRVA
jgi:hypothetical protein